MSISTGVGVMTTTDKRDAAVAELLRTEAAYVSDMKVRFFLCSALEISVSRLTDCAVLRQAKAPT